MADNRVVVYKGPGEVAVEDIEYPKLEVPEEVADAMGMTIEAPHAVILKIVSTNICGSDQHMVRGRTTAPVGQTLGHEITGEVVEKGNDVQFIDVGDICSVPFNIACGRCRNCNERLLGRLSERQPGERRLRLRLRGHGRLGRRPGRVRDRPLRGLSTCSSSQIGTRRWRRSWTSPCSLISSPPAITGPRALA